MRRGSRRSTQSGREGLEAWHIMVCRGKRRAMYKQKSGHIVVRAIVDTIGVV